MCISEQIKGIVRHRTQRLPQIKAQREHLTKVLDKLDELDGLLSVIKSEETNQQGVYFSILQDNPKMMQALHIISTSEVRTKIKKQLERLSILEKRFGRETVRIAMIGYERQGKSTFLQAISGLQSDKVIPAYSGDSCTGAVSVIHNIDGDFRVEIEPYTLNEFLTIVKEKLEKFFPDKTFYINSPLDLQTLDLSGFVSSDSILNTEFDKFKKAYCEHVTDYIALLGRGLITLTDEDEVVKHVAQYERFDTPPESGYDEVKESDVPGGPIKYQKNYYKYVAVKHVDIYTEFRSIDSKLIELVDTVGLGDASNADKIEQEMFRVLREDCDAAIDLFKPRPDSPGLDKVQLGILEKIRTELGGRHPYKWIGYVINQVVSEVGYNVPRCAEAIQKFNVAMANIPEEDRPVAWAKTINGVDVDGVKQNLIVPLLELITSNLDDLDTDLMQEAKSYGEVEVYGALFKLSDQMEKVISGAAKKGTKEGSLFDLKMEELKQALFPALRSLDEDKYQKKRNKPCPEIAQTLESVIEGLYDVVPDEEDIVKKVDMGAMGVSGIFAEFCKSFYNSIFTEFENVSGDVIIPLRERVKMDLIELMFDKARLGRIPLTGYSIKNGPSQEWLSCLLSEKVKADVYPAFYEALNYIYTYNFNIEDTIEYDVSQSVGIIDQMNDKEFLHYMGEQGGSVSERAEAIWQELCNRVPSLQIKLRATIERFALIPSHSFSTRVRKFRFKIVWGKDLNSDMREFYRDNCYRLWDEFSSIEGKAEAFGKWNDISKDIADMCEKDKFTLTI